MKVVKRAGVLEDLDIGVNQRFSQCEDGSVCDIRNRINKAQNWRSETFGSLPTLFFS